MAYGRKISGGKYHRQRKKKLFELPGQERKVILRETKRKQMRVHSGYLKTVLLASNVVNVVVDGKVKKANIENVAETPQNTFFARQNRLMKGAIIQTSVGKAKITNRPSQEGHVNAILIKG